MKVQISLDNQGYCCKPDKYEIVNIRKRTVKLWKTIEIKELARLTSAGFSFIPGKLVDGMKAENCKGMQLFCLDFDSGIRFGEIEERCRLLEIPIAFAYYTFGSTNEKERFRVAFAHSTFIEDISIIVIAMKMLHVIFPESDGACTNADRLFLGGKELICCNDNSAMALVQLISPFHQALDQNGNYKRRLQSFCKKENILMINNRAAMGNKDLLSLYKENDDFKDLAIIHSIDESKESSFFVAIICKRHQSISRRMEKNKKKIDIDDYSECKLLDDFLNGENLNHSMKFAIITNLMFINGGIKCFLDTLKKYGDYDSVNKWEKDLKYMSLYRPKRCSGEFCPYYEKCHHQGTIRDTLAVDRKVRRTGNDVFYSLDETVECLRETLEKAYLCNAKGVHLIKAQTSIGKTTQYIDLISKHKEGKFLIALPTNILKRQVAEDLKLAGISKSEIFVTPSMNDSIFFQDEWEEVRRAHNRGLHNRKNILLMKIYEKIKDDPNKKAVAEECIHLIEGIKAVKQERIIVTTHAYLMQINDEVLHDFTVIIDEDILQLQVFNNIFTVSIRCLEHLAKQGIFGYSQIATRMLSARENEYVQIQAFDNLNPLHEEQLDELGCGADDNINDMQHATAFVRERDRDSGQEVVRYFCPYQFRNRKYMVLSATLNETIYKSYFANSMPVFFYEMKKVLYTGKVIQYTYHSLGRRDLSGKMEVFEKAREISGQQDLEIITFKECSLIRNVSNMNSANLHFGNTTGINALSGRDIGVIGTPYKTDSAYKLIACHLGADVNGDKDKTPKPRRVHYNGYSFYITSYSNELLRIVQLYALESELEQCIGRARLLRKKCTVYVFSAFPCEQADIFMGEYL